MLRMQGLKMHPENRTSVKGVNHRCVVIRLHKPHTTAAAKVNAGSMGACNGHVLMQRAAKGRCKGRWTSHERAALDLVASCAKLLEEDHGQRKGGIVDIWVCT